jgi:hypothetical protein
VNATVRRVHSLRVIENVSAVPADLPELVIDRGHPTREPPAGVRQTWCDNGGRLVATGGHEGQSWWMDWPGLATFRFGEQGPVAAAPVTHNRDVEIRDIFMRGVLPVVMLARGCEALHASAIATDDGDVIALCAISGTGKSSLALAMTASGARHFADDTVVYRVVNDRPVALSLPFPVRVDSAALEAAGRGRQTPPTAASSHSPQVKRVYQLSRDPLLDPFAPQFTAVPCHRRFEVLLTHSHPFEMGSEVRQRAFHEHLLAIAKHTDVWDCRFAPALEALPSLAAKLVEHAATT